MKTYYLTMKLVSDTSFGRGEGLAGLVDTEIEHDVYGCPFIGGRTLKGLLREEWRNIHDALGTAAYQWVKEARFLLGVSGDTRHDGTAHMHIGAATLPPVLRDLVHRDVLDKRLTAADVLESLTTLRRQTAVNAETDAPDPGSLRNERVLIRQNYLLSRLTFDRDPDHRHLALLAACVLAARRGGQGRNRGRGQLQLRLHEQEPVHYDDEAFTRHCFAQFVHEVRS